MGPERASRQNRLHAVVVALCAWLFVTSPWVSMLRRIPAAAGWLDWSHVALGFAALTMGVVYARACTRDGGWRSYFPWLAGEVRAAARDVGGLFRRRLPSAEPGGLFAVIEGLLLLALLVVGVTGAAWFVLQGSDEAVVCRGVHVVSARVLLGLIVAHVLAVASHLFELA
jgi:cytochrome b561